MPWFPDFVAAAELARREVSAAGRADPVAQYLTALTRGDAHALETTWPGHLEVLDPYAGDVHGHRHWREFVHTSQAFLAERLVGVERVASTVDGTRAAVELLAHLQLDGEAVTWPVAVVAETVGDRSVVFRTYGSQWPVVGRRPVRAPILDADPAAAPGDVVGRYLAALGAGDRDAVVDTFAADGYLREAIGEHAFHLGTDELDHLFARWFSAGGGVVLDPCAVTDDGVCCALEHNCVRWGSPPLPPQAALAVFERGHDGLLAAVRCYDDVEAPIA
jgi:hypothetical protein